MEIEILNQEKMDNYNFTKGKWGIKKGTFGFQKNCTFILSDELDICLLYKVNSLDEEEYNAQLISKAPEMLEKLSEIVNILDIKCTDGCVNKTWRDFQNGNGEDVGLEIDKFIKDTKQLIKEATEL